MSLRSLGPACVAAVLALAGVASACRPADVEGIVLVTLDTTRADRLGCYGYPGAKTPNLDALAGESARFADAQSAVTTTLASHTTIMTGLYPPAHGVRYNGMFRVAPETRTVAEILRAAGWTTAAVPAAFPVTAKTGLGKGFETYLDLFSEPGGDRLPLAAERPAADVVDRALHWLDGTGDRKFFLWVHLFDPHWPYEPPFPFSAAFAGRPYDGEIAYVDHELGRLFEALRAKGRWRNTAVVVAGDHGEGLFDHGERQHGSLAYASTLHVPLIIKAPGRARPSVVSEPVSLVDITPTILDLAGVAIPPGLHGVSLRPALAGDAPPRRAIYFESLTGSLNFGWSPIEGMLRGKWKLIRSSAPELYDRATDPQEGSNLYRSEAPIAADLESLLDESLASWSRVAPSFEVTRAAPDAEALARLASLGYVGGSVSGEARGGPAPVTKIHLEGELLRLRDLAASQEWAEATDVARRILEDDPGNRFALYNGAAAAVRIPDVEAARSLAARCIERYPDFVPGVVLAAHVEIGAGRIPAAIGILQAGLARVPGEPTLTYPLAVALAESGKTPQAARVVDLALATPGASPSFFVVRALLRAREGDQDGAMAALREALAHGYRDLEALRSDPQLKPLRSVPGFGEALAAMASE